MNFEKSSVKLEIINMTSRIVEVVCLMNSIIDIKNHEILKERIKGFDALLSEEEKRSLAMVSRLGVQGLEVLEFLLYLEDFNDLEAFEKSVRTLDSVEFLYRFFGDSFSREEVKKALENKNELKNLYKRAYWIAKDYESAEYVFLNPREFMDGIFGILRRLNNDKLHVFLEDIRDDYKEKIVETEGRLKQKHPLEVSQDIMGKRFQRISDYDKYIFIPSYFRSPGKVRYMNEKTLILVYNLLDKNHDKDAEKQRINQFLRVIADQTRFDILELLREEPLYGKQIAERLNLTTATISHHMDQLKEAGLINEERVKNTKYFSSRTTDIKCILESSGKYLCGKLYSDKGEEK